MAKRKSAIGAARGVKGRSAEKGQGTFVAQHGGEAQLQMFRSLADHSHEFIGMCDLEFKPFYVNEAGRRLVGLGSLEEACAVKVQDYFFPEDQRYITEEFFPKVLREGAAEVEIRFRHFQTGAAVWMIYNVFQVRDAQGSVSGYATVSRDITERKQAEDAMHASEAKYRAIVENAGEGISISCTDGLITFVNKRMADMLGFDVEEMVGRPGLDFAFPDWECRVREVSMEVRERGVLEGEFKLRRKDGSPLWTRYTAVRVFDEHGKHVANMGLHTDITERKLAHEAIKASEEQFRRAIEDAPIPVIMHAEDGEVLQISRSWTELTGYTRADVPTLDAWLTRACGEGADAVRKHVQELFKGDRRTIDMEFPVRTREGKIRHWSFSASSPGTLRDGRRFVVGMAVDVTERTWAEEGLRASEKRYRTLFESMTEGFALHEIVTDEQERPIDYRFLDVNPAFERMTGLKRAEVLGKCVREVLPGVEGIWVENYGRVALTGEPVRFENYAKTLGRWYEVFAYCPVPRQFAVVFMDITARKQAEVALRESEERLLLALQAGKVGMWEWDLRTSNVVWSDRIFELIGEAPTAGGAQAELFFRRVHPEDMEEMQQSLARARESGAPWQHEFRVVRRDGQVRWLAGVGRVLRGASGEPERMIGVNYDISERRMFQAELQRLVDERTERLQELVGELEHFSYTITHDLKSPLRAMRGFAEMMAMTCGECERVQAKEFLGRISTSAERMDHLIADALSYSRSVRQELPLEDVDAGALLRGMLDTYPELQPDKARIVVEGPLPVVLANKSGLTQVFSNLLGNAVKFVMPGGKPDVRVWAEPRPSSQLSALNSQPPEWVRIWVEDNGIGISKEMLPRVFDMFARGSRDYEGTGIGLALVRKVAQRMGGKVGVESEEGKGSRFWIELSCRASEPVLAKAVARKAGIPGEGTVLYVEDEESDAMFMEEAFKGKGLAGRLRVVGDGRAAIQYLSGAGDYGNRGKYPVPALVLLDLNLPQVSGFGVLEWMRNNPEYARLPVVIFSSSAREDDRVKARELGANEFVSKPGSGLKFGEVVEELRGKWLEKTVSR